MLGYDDTLPNDFLPTAQSTRIPQLRPQRVPLIHTFGHKVVYLGSTQIAPFREIFARYFPSYFVPEVGGHACVDTLVKTLEIITSGRSVGPEDYFVADNKAHFYRFGLRHSILDLSRVRAVMSQLDFQLNGLRLALTEAETVVLTLETARVPRLVSIGEPMVHTSDLAADYWRWDITGYAQIIRRLRKALQLIVALRKDRTINVIFAVAPQRSATTDRGVPAPQGDPAGLLDFSLNRALMRVAAQALIDAPPKGVILYYFPLYELIIDALRIFDPLLHADYGKPGSHTTEFVVKTFILTYASNAILGQIETHTSHLSKLQEITRAIHAGRVADDPGPVAMCEEIERELDSFGIDLGPCLMDIRWRLMTEYQRPYALAFKNFLYPRSMHVVWDAQRLAAGGRLDEARMFLDLVIAAERSRWSIDPEAANTPEMLAFNTAICLRQSPGMARP